MSDETRGKLIPFRSAKKPDEGQASTEDVAHSEAVSMLERALDMLKQRRCIGLAVSMAFDDRAYGALIPTSSCDYGTVLAATVQTAHYLMSGVPR